MMKKNGFISTSLIYSFFILFLLLMTLLLSSYSSIRILLEEYKSDIKSIISEDYLADVNIYIYVNDGSTPTEVTEVPTGYNFNSETSYCDSGSTITFDGEKIVVTMSQKDTCYAYFDPVDSDIIIHIMVWNTTKKDYIETSSVPSKAYVFDNDNSYCKNGGDVSFNATTRQYTISATKKDECYLYFKLKDSDLVLHIYKEVYQGTIGSFPFELTDGTIKYYTEIYDGVPNTNKYYISMYKCDNDGKYASQNLDNTVVDTEDGQFYVEAYYPDECYVFFDKLTPEYEIYYYIESRNGQVSGGTNGGTSGVMYDSVDTDTPPSSSIYKYADYVCYDYFEDGVILSESDAYINCDNNNVCTETINDWAKCYVYFDKRDDLVDVTYYVQRTANSNDYYQVEVVPEAGYVYSYAECNNSDTIVTPNGSTIDIDAESADSCKIFYDIVIDDVTVLIYKYNYSSKEYDLVSNIPTSDYKYMEKMSYCDTFDSDTYADVEYNGSSITVETNGQAVCYVYFGGN